MFGERFTVAFAHRGGPTRGNVIDLADHELAGFRARLVDPSRYPDRGSDLWIAMEGDLASGFVTVWGGEAPVLHPDGTTTGQGPAPRVVSFQAQRM